MRKKQDRTGKKSQKGYISPIRHLKAHLFGGSAACLRTIYDALYKSTHHHYHHYTGQSVLAGTPVKNWMILLEQSFTARMPLLTATSAFGLGRRC